MLIAVGIAGLFIATNPSEETKKASPSVSTSNPTHSESSPTPIEITEGKSNSGPSDPLGEDSTSKTITSLMIKIGQVFSSEQIQKDISELGLLSGFTISTFEEIGFGYWKLGLTDAVSPETARTISADLVSIDGLETAEPDYPIKIQEDEFPVDETDTQGAQALQSGSPWGLDRIDQRSLPLDGNYSYGSNGSGVIAYIVDTGVMSSHVEFGGRVATGFDGMNDGNGTEDCNGHGTHVAGILAGATYGVAKAATIVPVRVLDCAGQEGNGSLIVQGLNWIVNHHQAGQPAVVNMSLIMNASNAIDDAVRATISDGITVVVASGNFGANLNSADACLYSPARVAEAITVNASNSNDDDASFSNFGRCTDLYAPGVGIRSAYIGSTTATTSMNGTSMATPHVAGVAARILSTSPLLSPMEVWQRIDVNTTAVDFGWGGYGDPNKLLYIAAPYSATSPIALNTPTANAHSLIYALYNDIHGRAPDQIGLNGWTNDIVNSRLPASHVVRGVLASTEYYSARITATYQSVLGRDPEPSGLSYWLREIETSRLRVDDLAMIHTASDEFFNSRGQGNNSQYVEALYQMLLGRSASQADRDYWSSRISSSSRFAAVWGIYQSDESAARRINALYQNYFQRDADRGGIVTYTPMIQSLGDNFLRGILVNSAEYLENARTRYPQY